MKCRVCRSDIDDDAIRCPQCREKQGSWIERHTLLAVFGGLFLAFIVMQAIYWSDGQPSRQATQGPSVEDRAKQPQRLDFINEAIRMKIFTKVNFEETVPDIYVGPAFHLLDYDQKQSMVSVVYAYTHVKDQSVNSVQIYDNMNGKEIGQYSFGTLEMH